MEFILNIPFHKEDEMVEIKLTPQELGDVQKEINELRTGSKDAEKEMLKITEERDLLLKNFSEVTTMLRKENRILAKIVAQHRDGDIDLDPQFKRCSLCDKLCDRDTLEIDKERQLIFPDINNSICYDCRIED